MPDLRETRDQLREAREEKEKAREALSAAQEQLRKLEAEQAELDRVFNPKNEEHIALRDRLVKLRAETETAIKDRTTLFGQQKEVESGIFKDFSVFSDPRQQIGQFPDNFPFLLLPVRIETRFKTVTIENKQLNQLWVRIYPDECAVDTFEATLTVVEVDSARSYWADIWRAGGVEDEERGAWRALVGSHGSGRAAWIVENYRPVNIEQKPGKIDPADIILVITTDQPLSDIEVDPVIVFWRDTWLAAGDRAKEDLAREALENDLGAPRASEIVEHYKPINLDAKPAAPLKKTDVGLQVATVVFPPPEATPTKTHAWSQAPRVNVLPDRFVLIGYSGGKVAFEVVGNPVPSPLIVGPDPSAVLEDQLRQEDGQIVMPEEIRWMVDFERAVKIGLGFKIDLTAAQASLGFERLLALGIRLSADQTAGQALIEELFQHHQNGRQGLSLLPQGTPTNNTETAGAGFTRSADADASFDDIFKPGADTDDLFVAPEEWARKRDGQWLAEYLGIDVEMLKKSRHSDGTDQCEARAMNAVLWPATLGYMMETMMQPVFDDLSVEQTRWFFNNFVSGRGAIPAIRIGNQPYGILPTTAFSRMAWLDSDNLATIPGLDHPRNHRVFLRRLSTLLGEIDKDWARLADSVSFVGKPPGANNDPHKILLDIVGLHSGSVEFYQRYAQSLEHLFNLFNIGGWGSPFFAALSASNFLESGLQLLRRMGYTDKATPDILNKFFTTTQNLLKGPVVDDRPLSETESIRKYTDEADENVRRNYIQWLIDAAQVSLETIRQEKGFKDNKAPTALLYLMLRHALVLGYWDTSLRLHREADIQLPSTVMREPSFIHVRETAETSESRWSHLYKHEPRITNNQSQLVADFIPQIISQSPAARYLKEQIGALKHLKDVPTARLERAFAEHIDCCSYRLDAWRLGLVHYQLAAMRYQRDDDQVFARKGLYLGAYGWLEEIKSENKVLTPKKLDPELDVEFNKPGDAPLMSDNTNAGYIHAPSLNHAVTAAVLRNGYLSNATPANPQTMSVNLSSERVRRALSILEGIRGGQSLGALLGYQFERGLHDRHNQAEVDQFIFRIRKAFPLRANRMATTKKEDENVSIEAIEARNVMDGVRLVEHIKKTGDEAFPFGIESLDKLPKPTGTQAAAINAEVQRLLDTHDAVADLALAEGVHQAVQGNYDRVASTLDTYSKGNFPPEPDVVQTPRSGIALTHRIGLQLESGVAPSGTPRSKAEPALNRWLAEVLPTLSKIFCQVEYFDPIANAQKSRDVTLQDLQLQPIDVLYLLQTTSEQSMGELDDRILLHVINTFTPRPDVEFKIKYLGKPADEISIFEVAPLVASLRSLVLRSCPLRASDISLQTESRQEQDEAVFVNDERIDAVRTPLEALHTNLTTFNADPANIDAAINGIIALLTEAAGFGIPQTGWGWVYEWKRQAFNDVLKRVDELAARWDERLIEYNALIIEYNALPDPGNDAEKFALLERAERFISTQPTFPMAATHADFKTSLDVKLANFTTRLGQFKTNVLQANTQSLTALLTSVKALLPVSDFDLVGIELAELEKSIVSFAAELNSRAQQVATEADNRLKASESLLTAHNNAASAAERVQLLEAAARSLLGDEFRLIPEFGLAAAQGDEWEKALDASTNDKLFRHQTQTLKVDFPVDDWLYGVARVREKLHHWERCMMLVSAFGKAEPQLQPIQLPSKPDDHWLALEFPAEHDPGGDRLLYTAHYATPFKKSQRQCGLLLDEWTEVIPANEETTGIAFHYDRPNSEPPQVMLMVTPAASTGAWQWRDLVDALNETLEMAKKRAVEPVHVNATAYARFLPATVMAVTVSQISINANLAINNSASEVLLRGDNG